MPKCKWCGKSSWFLSIGDDGICTQKCGVAVRAHIQRSTRILQECLARMRETNDLDVRLARAQTAIRHLRELVPYYDKGLVSLKPSPQEWVARLYLAGRRMVRVHIQDMYDNASAAVERLTEADAKVGELNRVLKAVEKYRVHLGEDNALTWRKKIERGIGAYLVEKAERAEGKGQTRRALDQYIEALDMLRTDGPDQVVQQAQIDSIKERIRDLGGKIPRSWEEEDRLAQEHDDPTS